VVCEYCIIVPWPRDWQFFFQKPEVVPKNVSSEEAPSVLFWVKESGGVASVDLIFYRHLQCAGSLHVSCGPVLWLVCLLGVL
jgi:hypothetical protein